MSDERTIDILNDLLAAEYDSALPRLREADTFVNWAAAEDGELVDRLAGDVQSHERDLTQLILRLRGAPVPPRYATWTGGLHYVRLDYLMPQIIESVRQLVAKYESVGPTGHAEADALIARNLSNYRRHLETLENTHSNVVPAGRDPH